MCAAVKQSYDSFLSENKFKHWFPSFTSTDKVTEKRFREAFKTNQLSYSMFCYISHWEIPGPRDPLRTKATGVSWWRQAYDSCTQHASLLGRVR